MRPLFLALSLSGLTALVLPATLRAQATPAQMLESFRPMQKDLVVDYDTPAEKAEIEACKVETQVDKKAGTFAYILRDAQGRILRKFADTDGKKDSKGQPHLDQWSYYKDGFEIYREIDKNEDGVLDECRWLNSGGTRTATVSNNRIASWLRLSPEEASKVLVQAIVAGNPALVETLIASPEELTALGVPQSEIARSTKGKTTRVADMETLRKGLTGWNGSTTWSRFDGMLPHVLPADAGLKSDVVLYENAFIFAANTGTNSDPMALAYLQASELVDLGGTWKFVELPRAIDPQKPETAAMEGGIRAALYQVEPSSAPAATGSPELEEALKLLADHDQKAPAGDAPKQDLTKFHVDRVNILFKIIKLSTNGEEQLNFTRQAVDSLAAAFQTGLYPAAVERLKQYSTQDGPIASYADYRRILAEYALEADLPGSDYIQVQKDFLGKLEKFLETFPKSYETPDVLFQLASINEFNAEEEKARAYYQRLVTEFPEAPISRKAAGAQKRLDLVGKPLDLAGPSLDGKTVSAADMKGKTLLVTFWTTGADPVRRDLPEIVKIAEQFRAKNFTVLAVNLDSEKTSLDSFLKQSPLPWPVIFEPGGMDSRLADELGIISIPTMILIDAEGKVINRNIRTAAELQRFLERHFASGETAKLSLSEDDK